MLSESIRSSGDRFLKRNGMVSWRRSRLVILTKFILIVLRPDLINIKTYIYGTHPGIQVTDLIDKAPPFLQAISLYCIAYMVGKATTTFFFLGCLYWFEDVACCIYACIERSYRIKGIPIHFLFGLLSHIVFCGTILD